MKIGAIDQDLLREIADGLPLVERPYQEVGRSIGLSEEEVIERLRAMIDSGVIKRFGVIVRHRELGYRANAMVAWNVPDDQASEVGPKLAQLPFVTLCYERLRHENWPYNLYNMIHGKDRETVLSQIDQICGDLGMAQYDKAILFSRSRYKQCGAHYVPAHRAAGTTAVPGAA